MNQSTAFAGGLFLVGLAACSASSGREELSGRPESVGSQTSALVCAQAVAQQVPITGLYQDVYEVKGEFQCTGETRASGKADVTLTPLGDDKWSVSVSFGSRSSFPFTQTATEKDGVLSFYGSFAAGAPGLNSVCGGMSAQSGSVRVTVEDGTMHVRQYCRWQSGAGACDRHYDLSATVALACATGADGGVAEDASAPEDASAELDATAPDASNLDDAGEAEDASFAEDSGRAPGKEDASPGSGGGGDAPPPGESATPPAAGTDGGPGAGEAEGGGGGSGGCQTAPPDGGSALGAAAIGLAWLLTRGRERRRSARR